MLIPKKMACQDESFCSFYAKYCGCRKAGFNGCKGSPQEVLLGALRGKQRTKQSILCFVARWYHAPFMADTLEPKPVGDAVVVSLQGGSPFVLKVSNPTLSGAGSRTAPQPSTMDGAPCSPGKR